MVEKSKVGLILLIISLFMLLLGIISITFLIEQNNFIEESYERKGDFPSGLTSFEILVLVFSVQIFPYYILPAVCLITLFALSLIFLGTRHGDNFGKSLIGLIMWTIFIPIGCYRIINLEIDYGGLSSILPYKASLFIPLLFWINISVGLPIYRIGGKTQFIIAMIIIVFSSFLTIIFSIAKSERAFIVVMELAFSFSVILQIVAAIRALQWTPNPDDEINEKWRNKRTDTHGEKYADLSSWKESPLENATIQEIIRLIIKRHGCTLKDLSKRTRLNSTMLNQHIDLLLKTNILKKDWIDEQVQYNINEPEKIIRILYMMEMDKEI